MFKAIKNILERVYPRKIKPSEKKIAREIACHMSHIKKVNTKANFHKEIALLNAITNRISILRRHHYPV